METEFDYLNPKIIEHFTSPRNIGEIENADGTATVGDPSCGDHIKVWIKIKDNTIVDFKYKVFGCWGAISTTSVVSELAIGKTLKEAIKLTDDDVIVALGGIPENKQHCSLLGIQGLRAAIADYIVKDNHKRFVERIELYRSAGYDIPAAREKIVRFLDNFPVEAKILDIGTGKGHLAIAIARSGRKCTSIDISREEIRFARLNAIYAGVDDLIDFQLQDARRMNFPKESFDCVLTAAFFHHLAQSEVALNEMLRVCKPSGELIISDLNEKGLKIMDEVHQKEGREHVCIGWRIDELEQWFKNKKLNCLKYSIDCEDILIVKKND